MSQREGLGGSEVMLNLILVLLLSMLWNGQEMRITRLSAVAHDFNKCEIAFGV